MIKLDTVRYSYCTRRSIRVYDVLFLALILILGYRSAQSIIAPIKSKDYSWARGDQMSTDDDRRFMVSDEQMLMFPAVACVMHPREQQDLLCIYLQYM